MMRLRPPWRSAMACLTLGAVAVAIAGCSSSGAQRALNPARPTATTTPPMGTTTSTAALPPSSTTTAPSSTTAASSSTTSVPLVSVAATSALRAGAWSPIGLIVNGTPTLTATFLQGRPGGPLTGVARINAAVAHPVLYAGAVEPGGSWPNQRAVTAAELPGLVAAFNSGFHTYASSGGWFDHGRSAVPLRAGAASLVIRADGSATVGLLGRDVSLTPDVVSVRQNLGLLVDGGADLSGAGSWGATLGRVRYTWRSGLGVDAAGNLIYAAGPGLDALSLAQVLIQAGAVRAMELDINPAFVGFAYYAAQGSAGTDLVPGMAYSPTHWLSGSSRDFIAVFTR
jgi:hypothetical protein